MIILTDKKLLAKGGERYCYINPLDKSKIIKVLNPMIKQHNNQNELEYKYYSFLYSRNDLNLINIAKCYGWIETNLGKGLVFDRILDYDGKDAKHFRYYLRNKLLTKDLENKLLDELKTFLEVNLILFVDVSTVNLFCQRINEQDFRLVIFDGLGARRDGMKLNLYMKSKLLTKYKINKQWKKFLKNYRRDKLN